MVVKQGCMPHSNVVQHLPDGRRQAGVCYRDVPPTVATVDPSITVVTTRAVHRPV
jgi:hypothetical protein